MNCCMLLRIRMNIWMTRVTFCIIWKIGSAFFKLVSICRSQLLIYMQYTVQRRVRKIQSQLFFAEKRLLVCMSHTIALCLIEEVSDSRHFMKHRLILWVLKQSDRDVKLGMGRTNILHLIIPSYD